MMKLYSLEIIGNIICKNLFNLQYTKISESYLERDKPLKIAQAIKPRSA